MCGFLALLTKNDAQVSQSQRQAVASGLMRMRARGPDGESVWVGEGVSLGHRRLAIIDLDPRASQPMVSEEGRYVIAFNGEIYNHSALRNELEIKGFRFRTTSDTEVILTLFAAEGEAMLPKLHGMFAFVIWDNLEHRAFVARDSYGIKPLFMAEFSGGIIFASQVKAILDTGLISREPDPHGQAGFWMLGSVPEPYTWFKAIHTFRAGHHSWIDGGRVSRSACWEDIGAVWREASMRSASIRDDVVRESVRGALQESVRRHLVSDVPVGVFLSGGVDSGALAGLMVEAGARDLEGITIAYDEFTGLHEDEAPVAASIAAHYDIRHTVRRISREEFEEDMPRIFAAMDQPSIDGINTWYASKAVAERGLKVVVSGLGGDELFQGYPHFRTLPRLLARRRFLKWLPGAEGVLGVVGRLQARRSGNLRWKHLAAWTRTLEGAWWLRRTLFSPDELPAIMGRDAAQAVLEGFDPGEWVRAMTGPSATDALLAVGQIESTTYMRNQLLRDSDWASMDHSVELRTPLVDAHLLRSIAPFLSSFRRFPNKSLIAEAPLKSLPRHIIERPKTGFGIPVGRWILGESIARGGDASRVVARKTVERCYSEFK